MDWYDRFTRLASSVDDRIDEIRLGIKLRNQWLRPLLIQPYRGHGTAHLLYLKGRVLEQKGITSPTETDSVWENILNTYRRFSSDEVLGARVRARFGEQEIEAPTDNEGFFDLRIEPPTPLISSRLWHDVELELIEPQVEGQGPVRAVGHALVPPPQAQFGVISDIDDTIVRTSAMDPLTMARIVVLNNPFTRVPFEGVAAFYLALRKGTIGRPYNPIFYVSSSPWNLYDLLIDFLRIHGIPLGPLFLRDVGLEPGRLVKGSHLDHKMSQIRRILDTHPDLPFLLIGDSGQEDPEIYREVAAEYPGRIKAIYIRDVALGDRDVAVNAIIKELSASGVEMVLTADTVAAAGHAASRGFIPASALPAIRARKAKDEQLPTLTEQLPGMGETS